MELNPTAIMIVIMAIFAAVVGLGMVSAVVSSSTNYISVVETLGTADSTGYLSGSLAHTPITTPSIQCS